jgi:hypothetical protein
MNNTCFFVQILECLGDLNNDVSGEVLAKVCQTHDLMKQFAARAQFKDDEVVLPRFMEVDELDNVWMVELSHDLYLLENICALQVGY